MKIPTGKTAFLVCGDDEFRVAETTRELIDALVPQENREYGLETVDGRVDSLGEMVRAFRAVRDALVSDGLFGGGEKTVWFREPAFLSNERLAKCEDVKKFIADISSAIKAGLPEGSRLVVSTVKINRGQTFFKTFASASAGAVFDLGSGLRERELREQADIFLSERLAKTGLEMPQGVRNAFLSRVGTNSRQIVSELEKLACWCGGRKTVTQEDVAEIVAADATAEIWDLPDAFAARDAAKTVSLLERHLAQGENAVFLAQTILNAATTLLLFRDAQSRRWTSSGGRNVSWDGVPEEIGEALSVSEKGKDIRVSLSGWRASKVAQQAAVWKVSELRMARHRLLELREELVSKQLPENYIMETRILQAMGKGK